MDQVPPVRLDNGVDLHFYLDRLAKRIRGEKYMDKSIALPSVLQEACPKCPPLLRLQISVACFSDRPFQLRPQREMRVGKDKRTPILEDLQRDPRPRLSFGLPPKQVPPIQKVAEEAKKLKELPSFPKTAAFGEIGLDYTEHEADWQDQRVFLEQLLFLLKDSLVDMPIVVHCRENVIPRRSAREDLCSILSAALPKEQYLQVHYSNGTPEDARHWLNAFPNTFLFIVGGAVVS